MLDTLGDFLNPYRDVIGAIAGAVTTLHSVSKAVFLNDIRKRGTADGFSAFPFLGGIVMATLNLELSFILGDAALIRTNIIGLVINIVCLLIFYIYTSKQKRPQIRKQFTIAATIASACVIYVIFENPEKIQTRLGYLLTVFFVLLLGLPLLRIRSIIRKKSSENLPFPMIVAGMAIGIMWLTYGISIKKRVLIYQNGLLVSLLSPQLVVCLIYPRTSTKAETTENKTVKRE
ncbi:sugar transporter SWEET1-like [Eupeodes corollae]|uniref:sugar transporter SWEET1-like n=1 Tax=Eupeodes corollae TaxID=290404 RepID=UPI00248F8647|nr:sugar transporter SWEET1-like [Eupeodes corollae]